MVDYSANPNTMIIEMFSYSDSVPAACASFDVCNNGGREEFEFEYKGNLDKKLAARLPPSTAAFGKVASSFPVASWADQDYAIPDNNACLYHSPIGSTDCPFIYSKIDLSSTGASGSAPFSVTPNWDSSNGNLYDESGSVIEWLACHDQTRRCV